MTSFAAALLLALAPAAIALPAAPAGFTVSECTTAICGVGEVRLCMGAETTEVCWCQKLPVAL